MQVPHKRYVPYLHPPHTILPRITIQETRDHHYKNAILRSFNRKQQYSKLNLENVPLLKKPETTTKRMSFLKSFTRKQRYSKLNLENVQLQKKPETSTKRMPFLRSFLRKQQS